MPRKMYVVYAGGIGDILLAYLEHDSVMGYFKAVKLADPANRTMLRTFTNGKDQLREFLKRNPYIDELECEDFTRAWGSEVINSRKSEVYKDFTWWDSTGFGPYEQPDIYLSEADTMLALKVRDKAGPYVTLHPESKSEHRTWSGRINYRDVIAEIVRSGLRCVLLGGEKTNDEPSPYLFNMSGYSIGLNAELVRHAICHIGSVSAFNCVATTYKKPSLIFGDRLTKDLMKTDVCGIFAQMRDKGNTRMEVWPRNYIAMVREFCHAVHV